MKLRQILQGATSARGSPVRHSKDEFPFDLPPRGGDARHWDDFTRRILSALVEKPRSIGELKTQMAIAPAVDLEKHLRTLQENGLVARTTNARGTEPVHLYALTPLGMEIFQSISKASSPHRREILEYVHSNPGVTVTDLVHALRLQWGVTSYHLSKLKAAGAIDIVQQGARRRLYPKDSQEVRALQLKGKATIAVARVIATHPGSSLGDVVTLTNESPRVVYYHLKRLMDKGLVSSSGEGGHHRFSPTEGLVHALRAQGLLLRADEP